MRLKWLLVLLVTWGLFIGLFVPFKAAAAPLPPQNISIGPAIVSKNINPGTTATGTLTVSNQGAQGYAYHISASPYGVEYGNYEPVFKALPGFANVTSWFSFSTNSGFLTAGKSIVVNYSITVPNNTAPGGYYVAVLAQTNTAAISQNKTAIELQQRVGSIFYLTVNGKVYEKGSINRWVAPFLQSKPVNADLSLKDSGKLYYVAKVNVYFEDILGGVRYQYTTQKIVLPRVIRDVAVSWPNPPSIGLYKLKGNVTIYGQKQLPTRYVLIVSNEAKVIILVIFIGLVILLGSQNIYLNVRKKKDKKVK